MDAKSSESVKISILETCAYQLRIYKSAFYSYNFHIFCLFGFGIVYRFMSKHHHEAYSGTLTRLNSPGEIMFKFPYLALTRIISHKLAHSRNCKLDSNFNIHVQYTQLESIRLRHLTIRIDSHAVDPHYRKSTSNRIESTTFSTHPV